MSETMRIRERVKTNGWSLREFFRRLDMDQSNMKMWEQNGVPDKHMPEIAAILCTTEAYLRGETDDPATPNSAPSPHQLMERERALKYIDVLRPDGSIDQELLEAAKRLLEAHKHIAGQR